MFAYKRLGEVIDLYVEVAWRGIKSSDGDVDGVSAVPPAGHYQEGLTVKNERVHKELARIAHRLEDLADYYERRLERLL